MLLLSDRDEGSAHGKSGNCISSENSVPTKYDSDLEEAYADQCNMCAVSALTHFNKVAASKMAWFLSPLSPPTLGVLFIAAEVLEFVIFLDYV